MKFILSLILLCAAKLIFASRNCYVCTSVNKDEEFCKDARDVSKLEKQRCTAEQTYCAKIIVELVDQKNRPQMTLRACAVDDFCAFGQDHFSNYILKIIPNAKIGKIAKQKCQTCSTDYCNRTNMTLYSSFLLLFICICVNVL